MGGPTVIRKFNRFELKYIIDAPLRDALCDELARNMRTDQYGDGDGEYRVTSLYYDSPDDACFRSKVAGIKYRRKVRVRTYGAHVDDPAALVHLEIKQRIDRTVRKRRIRVPLEDADALATGQGGVHLEDPADRAVAAEVELLAQTLQLRPACVISYQRRAWVGSEYEAGLRVTFDQLLRARGPERGLGPGLADHFFMPPTQLIMEVKVNNAVPLWVTRMLGRHQCQLRRVSKYCAGLSLLRSMERGGERFGDT